MQAMTKRPQWKRRDYCPLGLRTVAAVLATAKPALEGAYYRWWCAGSDWWGVTPSEGIIPAEMCKRMPKRDRFKTADEAMHALKIACEGLVLDGFGHAV